LLNPYNTIITARKALYDNCINFVTRIGTGDTEKYHGIVG